MAHHTGCHRCAKSQVVIVARLCAGGREVYVARYSNCFRGGSEVNVHAEAVAARPLARLVEIVREDPEAARG